MGNFIITQPFISIFNFDRELKKTIKFNKVTKTFYLFLGDCNFQHSTCDWEIVEPEGDEKFKFHRTNSNSSMAQGPSFDHFGDPFGYYMMTYGQLGSKEGAIATLKSPIFPGFDDNQCFHFHWIFNVRNH